MTTTQARFALTHEYAGPHPVEQQTFGDFRGALAAYRADKARYPSTIRVVHPDGSLGAPFTDADPIDVHADDDAYIAAVEAWADRVRKPRKQRTITLTGRSPVRIYEDEWPVIAQGSGDSYCGDPGGYMRAKGRGECDTYTLKVRQHADGRAIVYGVLDAADAAWGRPASGETVHAGLLLDGADVTARIPAAIREVGERCGLPDAVIRECTADLPAIEL